MAKTSPKKSKTSVAKDLGESGCDPATLHAGMDLAIGPKIAKLALRYSERDERHHVIEMGRHFPHGPFERIYESVTTRIRR